MRQFVFIVLLFVLMTGLAANRSYAQTYWQQQVNYDISVSLNDTSHTLDGFVKMEYINNSPDSLEFIYVHLWPNAYKNDKTAFSEQTLLGGNTEFYFSNYKQRGYINRLDFKVNDVSLLVEDHPQYIDVVKLILPSKLAPGKSVQITTPFHEKIQDIFSRGGHDGQYYALTQWYPKAALYDHDGWHAMPYLDWGEYFNDFGNYKVAVTLPANYAVAATGLLQEEGEISWLKTRTKAIELPRPTNQKKELFPTKPKTAKNIPSARETKTLHYVADNVTDFAWIADKQFIVKYDTVQLGSKVVNVWNYFLPSDEKNWKNSMLFTRRALRFYSEQLGEFPYPAISVVVDPKGDGGGMEYPMLTMLNDESGIDILLDDLIAHEVGHNWLQASLSSNERDHAWMDEGMNTYFEKKYLKTFYKDSTLSKGMIGKKLPEDPFQFRLDLTLSAHTDQPIETASEWFAIRNYCPVVYNKTQLWMDKLEKDIGKEVMHRAMQDYFANWKFKHPSPIDLKHSIEQTCRCSITEQFALLDSTGFVPPTPERKTKLTVFYNFSRTDQYKYLSLSPAIGFNNYDKLEIGVLLHNYNVPANKFQFIVTPMIGTHSKTLVGYGHMSYDWFPKGNLQKIQLYAGAARFSFDDGTNEDFTSIFKTFNKITPGIYVEWKKKTAISTMRRWADFRTYFISEQKFEQLLRSDSTYYDNKAGTETTVIPQLTLGWANERVLYPWSVQVAVQQVKQVVRTTVDANYFLNYNAKGQGVSVRFFAGKIFYTQTKTDLLRSQNSRYHFTMYGPNGWQDYTYSNVFAERNQSPEIFGRQIMIRDGGFKYRSDYSAVQPGLKINSIDFFDNWLAALNFEIDLPNKINPLSIIHIPLKVFADVGTSASPWTANSEQNKFLYSIGLQLRLFKALNIYYPIFQSEEFKEPNSVNDPNKPGGPNWWQKRLTFSIDLNPLKKLAAKNFVL